MPIYDDRLANHPVWASLAAAREAVDATRDKLADPEQIEEHAHIEATLSYLEGRLDTLDAQLVPFAPIDNINSNLEQISVSLRQFEENPGNRDILDQADSHAHGILTYLAQLPEATINEVENLREVGARYRRSMSAQIGLLTGEVNSLRATVTEIGETVAQQKSEIELEAGRLGEALTTNSAAFEQTQAERQENFTSQLSAFESQLAGALEEASQSAANALADLSEKSDAAIAEIEAIKERAEAASNYLGINALAAGYHDTADTEERRAFWLRLGAIGCFLGAIGASIFALIYHVVHTFTLDGFLTKAAVAIPFLVLAGYLARESSHHSERAHFNRQRQRQLESLPAYVWSGRSKASRSLRGPRSRLLRSNRHWQGREGGARQRSDRRSHQPPDRGSEEAGDVARYASRWSHRERLCDRSWDNPGAGVTGVLYVIKSGDPFRS
jgi:hypothetical protein